MGVGHEGAGAGARAPELLGQYPGDEAGLGPVTPGHLDPGHPAQPSQQPASTCHCQMR